MTKYRACYWRADDGQAEVVLTGPEHSHLDDALLEAEALAELEIMGGHLDGGQLVIGDWRIACPECDHCGAPAAIKVVAYALPGVEGVADDEIDTCVSCARRYHRVVRSGLNGAEFRRTTANKTSTALAPGARVEGGE